VLNLTVSGPTTVSPAGDGALPAAADAPALAGS
jgi:hypothetical protein